MPELPEVETIVRDLRRLVTGAGIRMVHVLRPDLVEGEVQSFEEGLRGARIEEVTRRAKNIVFRLRPRAGGAERLVINLGMTGRVLVRDGDQEEPRHLGARFGLLDGRVVLYQDVRRFGRLEALGAEAWDERDLSLGLEPLGNAFTAEALYGLSRHSRTPIKTWLMDQRRVVGVGNIYASEALFRARISPRKAARRLLRREAEALHDSIRSVLQEAIDFRGTTLLDYRDAGGEQGSFAARLRVYDRKGEPCHHCGTAIRRIVQGGRSTFYCPGCQR
ncbi:MAG: bifunctional DNA-formamidopyrimidine glycosylase/DNA-(apurinic or apyrimidinic site) lyase [Gemmatimonadota bacterium]